MENKLRKIKIISVLVLLLTGLLSTAYAHFGSKGPFGGTITCGITEDTTVYIGTAEGGVYESTRQSLIAWRARPVGLKSGKITALVHTSTYLIAGTADSGVYILNGIEGNDKYWNKINNGLTNLKIKSLVAIDASTILAGTEGSGVFKTTNAGASWVSVNSATLSNDVITSFAKAGGRIFLASQEAGIFASDDGGATWSDFNDANTLNIIGTNTISYNATTDELMVLNSNGLFIGGTAATTMTPSFSSTETGLPSSPLNFISNNGSDWYITTNAGVYTTGTSAISWTAINSGLMGDALHVTTIVPFQTRLVIGTAGEGIFKSDATSVSWVANNANFNNLRTYAMICKDASLVIAATEKGVFVSKDIAANYKRSNTGLIDSLHVTDLVFLGTNLYGSTENNGIFLSPDTGKTWSSYNSGLTNLNIQKLAVSEAYLYAVCSNGTVYQYSASTWNDIQNGLPSGVLPTSFTFYNDYMLLGTFGDGVFIRTEAPGIWSAFNSGLTNLDVTSVTTNGNKLFAGTDGAGVFVSDIASVQWTQASPLSINHTTLIGLDGTKVQAMAYYQGYVYASYKGGLLASSDNGGSWIQAGNQFNLPSYTDVKKISFVTTRVFVSTEFNSLYSQSFDELPILTSTIDAYNITNGLQANPNPNNGQFNLSFEKAPGEISEVIIFNSQGIVMGQFEKDSKIFSVTYPNGLYYIQVNTSEGSLTKKIIIE
jgi:photosystem II stability/assembly factor-like uncharacterized protein